MEADFVVIDPDANPLISYRIEETDSLQEILFAFMVLGDERIIKETYIMGKQMQAEDYKANQANS